MTETSKIVEADNSDINEEDYYVQYDPEDYYYESEVKEIVETTTIFTIPIFRS